MILAKKERKNFMNFSEIEIKKQQAKKIAALKEKLKGLELAYETDIHTIPVTKVKVDEIAGINMRPSEIKSWKRNKISLEAPVILDRSKHVIAGHTQYLNAKGNNFDQIDAVYIDSLKGKFICSHNLRSQFKNKDVCFGIAYSLYSLLYDINDRVSYNEFKENLERYFLEWEIKSRLNKYILDLDEEWEE